MVRTARDFVADVGEISASKSGGLVSLSKRDPKNGERDCHRLMTNQCRLALPLQQHYLDLKDGAPQIPFLRVRDWMQMMLDHNSSHILCGLIRPDAKRESDIWKAFWSNWERQEPNHPIFARARAGEVELERCIPLVLHGDEGRSKKGCPSWSSMCVQS